MADKVNLTPATEVRRERAQPALQPARRDAFAATLARETERRQSLCISSHAHKRLNSSHRKLTEADVERINEAVEKARSKGASQSLVMLDNLALVVSVKNMVVITAVDEARAREGIFTNIDSAVIA